MLRVSDDGIEFDPNQAAEADQNHLGLFTMQEGAHLVGGQLEVNSGTGTVIIARVPISSDDEAAIMMTSSHYQDFLY